ncbi:MAG: hypothetical protein LUQ22_08875, partial [Methanotrichaceae archaeon]|nr:hypothetical protein [Methanotrichaceae archaeon]
MVLHLRMDYLGKRRDKSLYWFADLLPWIKDWDYYTSDNMIMKSPILIIVATLLLAGSAHGVDWGKERPIVVSSGAAQEQPDIDGHIIVWADNRSGNYDIFMYDLETGLERWVCINPLFQISPAVSGERIVWQDMRSGNADIYMYDAVNRTETSITTAEGNQTQPDISGNYVIWSDDRDGASNIYLYDLKTRMEKRISSSQNDQIEPKISGDRALWMDKRSGDFDIYMYEINGSIESPLVTGKGDQSFPSIDGDLVAWTDNSSGESDIGYLNLSNKQQKSLRKPGMQTSPSVYKNFISYLNNGTEVWLYDTKSEKDFQLVPGSIKMEPSISDRGVVWADYRAGPKDPDIYMFDFSILADIPITSGAFNHTNPSISGDNIVWTDDRNGHF